MLLERGLMTTTISLSFKSQELIKQYINLNGPSSSSLQSFSSLVNAIDLVKWLNEDEILFSNLSKQNRKKIEFTLASLRAELLKDLLVSLEPKDKLKKEEPKPSKTARLKFYLLAIAGTVLAACEGFDSISTLLGVMAAPTVVTLLGSFAFAALAVLVFYGFNLVQVSKNLGVKMTDTPKVLDCYLEQLNEIKCLRKRINSYKLAELNAQESDYLISLLAMLEHRLDSLYEASKPWKLSLKSTKMKIAKNVFSSLAGILFFGGGFFAGQSVGVFLLRLLLVGILPTSLPVVLFSVVVGLAAFSLYWYVEKVGLQKLFSSFFGLDEEKIGELSEEIIEKQINKINAQSERIKSTARLKYELELAEQKEVKTSNTLNTYDHFTKPDEYTPRVSGSIYSFHRPLSNSGLEETKDEEDSLQLSVCYS